VTFTGIPGGDPTSQFASSHVIVQNGMLRLVTYRDPTYANKWTSGGLCQCGYPVTYGAFFVRSRISNAGPNEVELLWPANNQWPPEIDFNESGARWSSTSGTIHHGTHNEFVQENLPGIDLRQWHTWGVIWTPTSVTFTVDGKQWGATITTPAVIPHLAMTLDLQQRPGCPSGSNFASTCPSQDQAMYVDWVVEYARNA
jgi:beta-glucanase (GH16 family)